MPAEVENVSLTGEDDPLFNMTIIMDSECSNHSLPRHYSAFNQFKIIVDVYIALPLCLLGIIGNSVSFYIIGCMKGNPNVNFQLRALALADIGYLISCLFIQPLRILYFFNETFYTTFRNLPYAEIYFWACAATTQTISVWLVVLITCGRYLAICHPLQVKRLVTKFRIQAAVGSIVLASIIFNLPTWFDMKVYKWVQPPCNKTRLGAGETLLYLNPIYQLVYKTILCTLCRTFLPLLFVLVLNIRLLRSLRTSPPEDEEMSLQAESACAGRSKPRPPADQLTSLIVGIIVLFLCCETPDFVSRLLHMMQMYSRDFSVTVLHLAYLGSIINLLLTFNSSANFLVYCLAGKRFREMMRHVICGGVGDDRDMASGKTPTSTRSTYLSRDTIKDHGSMLFRFLSRSKSTSHESPPVL